MSFLTPFLRLFFKLLYHKLAWTYDWVAGIVSIGLWQGWVLAVLPYLTGPSVLELGHGPGHLQVSLLAKGLFSTGLDASPQMGHIARRRLKRRGHPIRLLQARAQALPLDRGSYDQVVATFPTEYINDPITLKEAWRVLKQGGKLVVLPVAWITGQRWMERYASGLFRITNQAPTFNPNVEFPLVSLLQQAGFQVRVEWVQLRSSTLVVIQAEKPGM
jgi:ubiquinone/menaquinone biosynthesis C-methylase UbiE